MRNTFFNTLSAIVLLFIMLTLLYIFIGIKTPIEESNICRYNEIVEREFVDVTTYNPLSAQTNEDSLTTASLMKIDVDSLPRIIAVSRDLLLRFPFGTKVRLQCNCPYEGEYIVADLMNKRFTKRIDVLSNDKVGKYIGMIDYIKYE